MINQGISIFELNKEDFENSKVKNTFIQSSESEWIGFVDLSVTNKKELYHILEENLFLMDYDVILFGMDIPVGECDIFTMLKYPQNTIYALCFRKDLLIHTGCYNRFLAENNNYEFLLRLALKGRVYSIPCKAEKSTQFHPITMAYIIRHYMQMLKENNRLDETFLHFVHIAKQLGMADEFHKAMNTFLEDITEYRRITSDTAPCLIFVGDETCYGVVADFANLLADEFVRLGQAVITTNDRYGDYNKLPLEILLNQNYKAIIGFQSPALESDTFQQMTGNRYQFWFDNPIFSSDFFHKTSKQTHILCQDADYARFIRMHFGLENSVQFPPAGEDIGIKQDERDEIYDLVFIGSYISLPKANYEDDFCLKFHQYMLSHTECTVEQGIRNLWQAQGVEYDEQKFMQHIEKLQPVCFELLQNYRHRVVESILSAGIKLHVFGDSWKKYQGAGYENLIFHPQVIGEEALHVWGQSKIGLNIMNGHKDGMTERIANIMLSGACCLSDETSYLKEHFQDGEDIVLYRANDLEQLPNKIRYLLQHKEERERIARAGREKALREHTWHKRAEVLLELIHNALERI